MLIAAHPDDEVIGTGAQLGRWADSTLLVHVTDGAPPDLADARAAGFQSNADYAAARRRELGAALAWLPRQPLATYRLGFTDQRVTHDLSSVIERLGVLIAETSPAVVMTHAYEGGHPDHDSVAFAVAALQVRSRFVHLEFAGYHQGPDGRIVTNRFAACTTRSVRFRLTPAEQRLKRLMLCAFRSQCRTLQPFGVTEEWLRVAPTYDFTRPPNGGRVWYEQFPWGMRAAEWTARVARLRAQGTGQERLRC